MKQAESIKEFCKKTRYLLVLLLFSSLVLIITILFIKEYKQIPPHLTLAKLLTILFISFITFLLLLKAKKNTFSSIFLLFTFLVGFELICFILLDFPTKENKDFSLPVSPEKHISAQIGSVPTANSIENKLKILGEDTVYNVHYTIDNYSKRVTPEKDSAKNKHALFFGCSITFGEGLEDNQTISYNFQKCGEYNSYNYGFSGYGTNHMLARLEYEDLSEQVVEKDGVAFYIFFWDHFYRTIGAMSRYTSWGHDAPYYYLKNNQAIRNKSFKEGRISSRIYESIYQMSIVKYFNIDFPTQLNEAHFDLVTAIIKQSKAKYQEQFENTEFYVVIHPSYLPLNTPFDFDKFKNNLTESKIKYIDLFDYITYGPKYTFVGDAHPNANTSKLIGEELYDRIKKN